MYVIAIVCVCAIHMYSNDNITCVCIRIAVDIGTRNIILSATIRIGSFRIYLTKRKKKRVMVSRNIPATA